MMKANHRKRIISVIAGSLAVMGTLVARGQQADVWNGGGGNSLFTTAANWGGTAPNAGGDLVFFAGANRLSPTNSQPDDYYSFNGITFNSGAGAFNIAGGRIDLNGGITNDAANPQTINNNLALLANATVNATNGSLTSAGVISGGFPLTKTGAGALVLQGANTFSGIFSNIQGLVQVAAIGLAGTPGPLGAAANGVAIGSEATGFTNNCPIALWGPNSPTLQYIGPGETTDRQIFIWAQDGRTVTLDASGSGPLVFMSGKTNVFAYIQNSTPGDDELNLTGSNTGLNTLAGDMIDTLYNNGDGMAIFKTGSGTWFLQGAKHQKGMVAVQSGVLMFDSISNVGTACALGTAGAVYYPGSSAVLSYHISLGNGASSGTLLYTGSTTNSSNRNFVLAGNGTISAGVNGGSLVLNGTISNLTTSGYTLTLDGSSTSTISGIIGDNYIFNGGYGPLGVTKAGSGTWALTAANSYSGATTVSNGTLAVSTVQTSTGNLTVEDGGILAVTVSGANELPPATLTLGSSAGATLAFSGLSSLTTAPINAGALVLNGNSLVNLVGGTYVPGKTYPLIAGGSISGAGGITVGSRPNGVAAVIVTNGNVISLTVLATNAAAPVITALPTAGGIIYGQSLASSTLSGGAASTAGTFSFTQPATVPGAGTAVESVTFNPANLTNYAPVVTNVSVSVSPASLTITADNLTKAYGQTLMFAGTAFTTSGLVGGDSVTSVTLTSAGATNTASVAGSPYSIVPSAAVGTGLGNYNITYVNGSLTVSYAKLWDGGAGTTSWSAAANWSPDGVPVSTNPVVLDNSFTNQVPEIDGTGGGNLATLTVNGAVTGLFLNYPGSTPQLFDLYGATATAADTGPLINITTNAPAAITANKINFCLCTNGVLFISPSKTLTLDNCYLSESGGHFAWTLTGGGTLTFSGSGPQVTFSGGLDLAQGTLIASDNTLCLPTSGTINFINGPGTNAAILSANSHTISALAGGNSNSLIQVTGATGLTVNGTTNTTFSGVIDDNFPVAVTCLTYAGTGSLTLNGINTYTGPTTISSGRLALGAGGAIASTNIMVEAGATFDVSAQAGSFVLGSGQTLGGVGSVNGRFTAGSGSAICPGTNGGGVGTLTLSNGFSLGAGAHYTFDISNGVAGQVVVTSGNVVLAGDFTGSQITGPVSLGSVFYLIVNKGAGTTTGTLAGAGDGGETELGGHHFRLSLTSDFGGAGFQTNGTGNDVAIEAIYNPAPTALASTNVGSLSQPVVQTVLTWQNNATNATGCTISRSTAGGPAITIGTVGANATSFTDTNAASTSAYVYTVQAFNASGNLGNADSLVVPPAGLTVDQRRQQFLAALAAVPPPASDLKTELPYELAWMLENPAGSVAFNHARARTDVLLQTDVLTTNTNPFEVFAAMDGYLLTSNLYTADMMAQTKQLEELWYYQTNTTYVSENYYFMYNGSGFLACEQWPDFTDATGQTGPGFKAALKTQLLTYFDRVVKTNLWEHGSPDYVSCDLAPIRMLAEFAQDPEVKQKAWDTLDWLMLNVACDWNQGYYGTAAARCKGWGVGLNTSPDNLVGTSAVGWLYYGAFRPVTSPTNFTDGYAFWMAYFRQYETPPIFQSVAGQRFTSFRHRSACWLSADPEVAPVDTDYKYTWHTTNYSLASDYTYSGNTTDMGKERMPAVFKWLSSKPESTLVVGMVNQSLFFPDGGLNLTSYVPSPNRMGYGMNPYSQYFQIQQTLIGVANVSPWYASQNGNAASGAGLDPLYYAQFYVPLTTQGAIVQTLVTNGWVFCHGGAVLFGIWTYAPNYFGVNAAFGSNVGNCQMLYSSALQNAWVFETASVDEYPGATNVSSQLAAFAADVLAHGILATNNMTAVLPQLQYTSIHGYTMSLAWTPCQTDNFWTVPPRFPALPGWNTNTDYVYTSQARSNGIAINYTRAGWPLLEDPWVNQLIGQTNLVIAINGCTNTYLFPDGSTNWGRPPALSGIAPVTVVAGQQVVVPFTVGDNFYAANLLTNGVSSPNPALLPPAGFVITGTGTNRSLTISPPATAAGTAAITLIAVNPSGAVSTEPVTVTVTPGPPAVSAVDWQIGGLQFQINGATGYNYTVQASTNLMSWANLLVTNPPVMPFTWSDTNAQTFPQRFYRVVLGP